MYMKNMPLRSEKEIDAGDWDKKTPGSNQQKWWTYQQELAFYQQTRGMGEAS